MKYLTYIATTMVLAISVLYSCKREIASNRNRVSNVSSTSSTTAAGTKKIALNAPVITCGTSTAASINIQVCAGTSGAPAGFSIQWMLKSDYTAYGWPSDTDSSGNAASFCKASFSGVPGCSNYNLAANACITVNIGENLFDDCGASGTCTGQLLCGSDYVFRAFAHNDPVSGAGKSGFSTILTCSTQPCTNLGCTFTQGYWKTHGPVGCVTGNNTDVWPVTSLQLGTVTYTDMQLCSILNTPAGGNGLLALAHQLIAAKLNIANGANGSAIAQSIADADALIGGLTIPPVGSGSLSAASTNTLIAALTNYNEGLTGPGHCSQ